MAENTNGRSRDGQGSNDRSRANRNEPGKENISNQRGQHANSRQSDINTGRSAGRRGTTGGSGIATKSSFIGSDYDGQLSDE